MTTYRQVIVQLTDQFTGDPAVPVWDSPTSPPVEKVVEGDAISTVLEGLPGGVFVALRAATVDVYGNQSAWSDYITTTTTRDEEAPDDLTDLSAIGGFRGAAVTWPTSTVADLRHYHLQWDVGGTFDEPLELYTRATTVWVTGLTPDVEYSFRVRAIDSSGNASGYSNTATATPSQVGSADIAAQSVTAEHVQTGSLDADVIGAGTLIITPAGGSLLGSSAIEVYDSSGVIQGIWHPTNGIKIFGSDPNDFMVLDDGYLRFYLDGVLTAEIGPEGILADSITLGTLPGGHNLILNSSFEGAAFSTAASVSVTFTDNSGTPGWKAANRTTALDNLTEGATALSATTLAF